MTDHTVTFKSMRTHSNRSEVHLEGATLRGGIAVVARLLATRLSCSADRATTSALWEDCRAYLSELELAEIIEEVEESVDGGLDTYPREYVLDALGHVVARMPWPLNIDGPAYSATFSQRMREGLTQRGFLAYPQAPR